MKPLLQHWTVPEPPVPGQYIRHYWQYLNHLYQVSTSNTTGTTGSTLNLNHLYQVSIHQTLLAVPEPPVPGQYRVRYTKHYWQYLNHLYQVSASNTTGST